MIDPDQGTEVRVQLWATKQTLGESRPSPQSPLYLPDPRHRMIEAKTDQRFQIEVVITKNFDFQSCRYVRALDEIDSGTRTLSKHIFNNRIGANAKKHRHSYHLSTLRTSNGGSWKNFGFAFPELKQDDSIDLTADAAAKEALQRGKITVTLQRGSTICTAFDPDDEPRHPPMLSMKVSKKVIKDQCKTHGFRCVKGRNSKNPPTEQWAFTPAEGKAGEPIVYTFTYVSRDVLLANKISKAIPANTPSKDEPEIQPSCAPEPSKANEGTAGAKRNFEIIDLTDVDEPTLPAKIETSPVPDAANPLSASKSEKTDILSDNLKSEPSLKPKVQISIKDYTARNAPSETKPGGSAEAVTPASKDRARKKMKLMKELESLKIQLQINEREQQMWELDEE